MHSSSRKCYICGQTLPYTKFYKDKSRTGGYENKCKQCSRGSRAQRLAASKKQTEGIIPIEFKEMDYREYWTKRLPFAQTEIHCPAGVADIVTREWVIEIKQKAKWHEAIGQVLVYNTYFMRPNMGIILLPWTRYKTTDEVIIESAKRLNVNVMFETGLFTVNGRVERKTNVPKWEFEIC